MSDSPVAQSTLQALAGAPATLLGLDLKYAKGIRQTNTGVNFIRHRNGETELMTLNAHFHLDGIEAT